MRKDLCPSGLSPGHPMCSLVITYFIAYFTQAHFFIWQNDQEEGGSFLRQGICQRGAVTEHLLRLEEAMSGQQRLCECVYYCIRYLQLIDP